MPLHLKGSSVLAECFHGCVSPFVGVNSIQQWLSLSHPLELVTGSGRVKNISNHLTGMRKGAEQHRLLQLLVWSEERCGVFAVWLQKQLISNVRYKKSRRTCM